MQKFDSKFGKISMIETEAQDTKAIKMKSKYIMAEGTYIALKNDESIDKAVTLDYNKVKQYINDKKNSIFKGATKFKINVFTDGGWRGSGFFGKNEAPIWYDAAKHYDDERGEVDEIYMIQILYL